MTEAEAIEILNYIGLNANYMHNKESRTGKACRLAMDTIRKYQKIEEIVKRYEHPDKEETDKFYWDIIGVVEDGL